VLASDSDQNHGTEVNENWGRELLELFSLGAGNYTEVDVREASRAFTVSLLKNELKAKQELAASPSHAARRS